MLSGEYKHHSAGATEAIGGGEAEHSRDGHMVRSASPCTAPISTD